MPLNGGQAPSPREGHAKVILTIWRDVRPEKAWPWQSWKKLPSGALCRRFAFICSLKLKEHNAWYHLTMNLSSELKIDLVELQT